MATYSIQFVPGRDPSGNGTRTVAADNYGTNGDFVDFYDQGNNLVYRAQSAAIFEVTRAD